MSRFLEEFKKINSDPRNNGKFTELMPYIYVRFAEGLKEISTTLLEDYMQDTLVKPFLKEYMNTFDDLPIETLTKVLDDLHACGGDASMGASPKAKETIVDVTKSGQILVVNKVLKNEQVRFLKCPIGKWKIESCPEEVECTSTKDAVESTGQKHNPKVKISLKDTATPGTYDLIFHFGKTKDAEGKDKIAKSFTYSVVYEPKYRTMYTQAIGVQLGIFDAPPKLTSMKLRWNRNQEKVTKSKELKKRVELATADLLLQFGYTKTEFELICKRTTSMSEFLKLLQFFYTYRCGIADLAKFYGKVEVREKEIGKEIHDFHSLEEIFHEANGDVKIIGNDEVCYGKYPLLIVTYPISNTNIAKFRSSSHKVIVDSSSLNKGVKDFMKHFKFFKRVPKYINRLVTKENRNGSWNQLLLDAITFLLDPTNLTDSLLQEIQDDLKLEQKQMGAIRFAGYLQNSHSAFMRHVGNPESIEELEIILELVFKNRREAVEDAKTVSKGQVKATTPVTEAPAVSEGMREAVEDAKPISKGQVNTITQDLPERMMKDRFETLVLSNLDAFIIEMMEIVTLNTGTTSLYVTSDVLLCKTNQGKLISCHKYHAIVHFQVKDYLLHHYVFIPPFEDIFSYDPTDLALSHDSLKRTKPNPLILDLQAPSRKTDIKWFKDDPSHHDCDAKGLLQSIRWCLYNTNLGSFLADADNLDTVAPLMKVYEKALLSSLFFTRKVKKNEFTEQNDFPFNIILPASEFARIIGGEPVGVNLTKVSIIGVPYHRELENLKDKNWIRVSQLAAYENGGFPHYVAYLKYKDAWFVLNYQQHVEKSPPQFEELYAPTQLLWIYKRNGGDVAEGTKTLADSEMKPTHKPKRLPMNDGANIPSPSGGVTVMEFLNEIGESDRLTAEVVLNDESLSNAEKMDILQGMGLEECIIHLASKYLNPEAETVDFRDLMSDRTKILANVLVKQEKWEALKIIVARDSQEVQAAFATFMANVERQSQKVEVRSSSSHKKTAPLTEAPPVYEEARRNGGDVGAGTKKLADSYSTHKPNRLPINNRANIPSPSGRVTDGTSALTRAPPVPVVYAIYLEVGNSTFSVPVAGEGQKRSHLSVGTPNTAQTELKGISASMWSPSGILCPGIVRRTEDGRLGISFTPSEAGQHLITVKRDGKPLPKTPFTIKVGREHFGDASKIEVSGEGKFRAICQKDNEILVETSKAGVGDLSVSVQGPSKAEVRCKEVKAGLIKVIYRLNEPGDYVIAIKFADHHVKESPLIISCSDERAGRAQQHVSSREEQTLELLNEIGHGDRLFTKHVLNSEKLSNATKLDILRQRELEERIIRLASKYLNPESAMDSDVEIVDFRDLMDGSKKIVANILIELKMWHTLKGIVTGESQEVQAAFATFMANVERQRQKEEVRVRLTSFD